MCGIFGYTGGSQAAAIVLEGLRKLEYRGYDSFGIAARGESIQVGKKQGRIPEEGFDIKNLAGTAAIGHTRWATHGIPDDKNAHPHRDCTGKIAVVHNGIIENYALLKRGLVDRGHRFSSDTDTEIIAHLLEEVYKGDLLAAVQAVLPLIDGSYAILVLAEADPRIVAARSRSPLVVGIGDEAMFAASDMTPILEYTRRMIVLEDGDVACLTPAAVEIYQKGSRVRRNEEIVRWSSEDVRKGGFRHFMLKEIFDQPAVFSDAVRALRKEELPGIIREAGMVTIVACGTSYHAALIFKYLLEEQCRVAARVELASEFRYFPPPLEGLVIGISQSGETADTLMALELARLRGCPTLAIVNVVGSSLTRIADASLLMHAGPEISVAATKSFIAELAVFFHLVDIMKQGAWAHHLDSAHRAIEEALLLDLGPAVACCSQAKDIFFVGRGAFYPVALEGALKMKEISYIHAEGYAAGEIKHGPFALLSPETPVVAVCAPGETYGVMASNIREMKARGTPLILLGEKDDRDLQEIADVFIPLPSADTVSGLLSASVILQLLAYHTADALGKDIDRPRNLAKSVTVE
ncbi:MAG: glutamine--fructose-6-phosphate transaminase (isomerizing) [Methanomicrobiales archaeon]|nr:glutamine--fructose-6-phosphate transaminase (isomerizing) [Methanomicrobiales archaeon]